MRVSYMPEADLLKDWREMYSFDKRPSGHPISTWPTGSCPITYSPLLVNRPLAARAEPGRHYSLLDNRYIVYEDNDSRPEQS